MRIKHLVCTLFFILPVVVFAQPNLVQNGNFKSGFTPWSGLIAEVGDPNAPNGIFGLGADIYQTITTTPGQPYELTFEGAADLFFGTDVSITVSLNTVPLGSYTTQPHTYNNQINRYDQMVWEHYTNFFTATSSSTRLDFSETTRYDYGLAAVSVVAVPEPSIGALAGLVLTVGFIRHVWLRTRVRRGPGPVAAA